VIEQVAGVLLEPADAEYLLSALDALLANQRPSAQLSAFIDRLRKSAEKLAPTAENAAVGGRMLGLQHDSAHTATYDLVDTREAAAILGCKARNVRDLGDRGVLPRHRAGGRWLFPIAAVEARAARRG
jgi:excisionase family DNA binding protein